MGLCPSLILENDLISVMKSLWSNQSFSSTFFSLLSGIPKEAPIVTPLMEYVRQKRAAESGMQVPCFNK